MSKHSTFDFERSTSHARHLGGGHGTVCPVLPLDVRCSMFDVRCSIPWALLLAVFLFLGGGFTASLFAGDPATSQTSAGTAPAPQLRAFTETNLLALLTTTLQRDYVKDTGELELILTQPWTPPMLPDQPLALKILELPTAGVTPAFIVRFELCTPDKSLGAWQTSLSARVWRDVWVAHTPLRRGDLISNAEVVRERRNVLNISEALANFSAGDPALELAEPCWPACRCWPAWSHPRRWSIAAR